MEGMFLIGKDELKELSSSKNSDRKMEILVNVLARPYREKTSAAIIAGGIRKGIGAGIDALDKMTAPPKNEKKKRGG